MSATPTAETTVTTFDRLDVGDLIVRQATDAEILSIRDEGSAVIEVEFVSLIDGRHWTESILRHAPARLINL